MFCTVLQSRRICPPLHLPGAISYMGIGLTQACPTLPYSQDAVYFCLSLISQTEVEQNIGPGVFISTRTFLATMHFQTVSCVTRKAFTSQYKGALFVWW